MRRKLSLAAEILGRRDDPAAKEACHQRLTATRAVSGCWGPVSHCARPSRLRGHEFFKRRQAGRRTGLDTVSRGIVGTSLQQVSRPGMRHLFHHHDLGHRIDQCTPLLPQVLSAASRLLNSGSTMAR